MKFQGRYKDPMYYVGSIVYFAGLGLIFWKLGWVVALGMFLFSWGLNIEQDVRIRRG